MTDRDLAEETWRENLEGELPFLFGYQTFDREPLNLETAAKILLPGTLRKTIFGLKRRQFAFSCRHKGGSSFEQGTNAIASDP